MPLVRERFLHLKTFEMAELKDLLEKARKLHQRLYQIMDFEMPSLTQLGFENQTSE